MFAADGVASLEDPFVRAPALAELAPYLFFDVREGGLVYAAYLRRLVLDAEQLAVTVLDGLLL